MYPSALCSICHNHPSSRVNPSVITDHLQTELQQGRLFGPLPPSVDYHVQISPMGLVAKPHSSRWRLIMDLSSPHEQSGNDGISSSLCSLHYASLDNAVDNIMRLGQSMELLKLDHSNAYRIIPVHPDDQLLLGVNWQGNTYIDHSLPFGLRSALKIFNAVADLLTWVLHCNGVTYVLHYLDDFLVFIPPGSPTLATMRSLVESTLTYIGAPIAHRKSEGSSTVLTFLGIQIDTNILQLSLLEVKVRRLQDLLSQWASHRSCTRKKTRIPFVSFMPHSHNYPFRSNISAKPAGFTSAALSCSLLHQAELGSEDRLCMVTMPTYLLEWPVFLSSFISHLSLIFRRL